jgi:hypothetical protein
MYETDLLEGYQCSTVSCPCASMSVLVRSFFDTEVFMEWKYE